MKKKKVIRSDVALLFVCFCIAMTVAAMAYTGWSTWVSYFMYAATMISIVFFTYCKDEEDLGRGDGGGQQQEGTLARHERLIREHQMENKREKLEEAREKYRERVKTWKQWQKEEVESEPEYFAARPDLMLGPMPKDFVPDWVYEELGPNLEKLC